MLKRSYFSASNSLAFLIAASVILLLLNIDAISSIRSFGSNYKNQPQKYQKGILDKKINIMYQIYKIKTHSKCKKIPFKELLDSSF